VPADGLVDFAEKRVDLLVVSQGDALGVLDWWSAASIR
jgi:hypothetical protein